MSLFDDNFIISMEAKAKAAKEDDEEVKEPAEGGEKKCDCGKEDCPECNPKADKGEEPKEECKEGDDSDELDDDAKVTPEEEAAILLAVDNDINADSITEATGFDKLIASDAEDAHYACLEAVSAAIAFDQADIACTEAYVNAGSSYEKQVITESFKDSVKKFGTRMKEFLIKIKNAVVRVFNKAVNYIKILASKISAKFASGVKLDKSKKVPADVTIRISEKLNGKFNDIALNAFSRAWTQKDPMRDLRGIMNTLKDTDSTHAKEALAKIESINKQDILNDILKEGYKDVKLASLQDKGDALLAELKTISKNVDFIKAQRKEMEESIKNAEKAAKEHAKKDVTSEKLNVLIACVNKSMACFNTKIAAAVALNSAWVSQRVKIVRALNKYQGAPESKIEEKDAYDKYKGMHESANLFADFLSMI